MTKPEQRVTRVLERLGFRRSVRQATADRGFYRQLPGFYVQEHGGTGMEDVFLIHWITESDGRLEADGVLAAGKLREIRGAMEALGWVVEGDERGLVIRKIEEVESEVQE